MVQFHVRQNKLNAAIRKHDLRVIVTVKAGVSVDVRIRFWVRVTCSV